MKLLRISLICFAVGIAATAALFTGCQQAPSARVVQTQSLKAIGESAEAAVSLAAHLFKDGRLSAGETRAVIDFYDNKFQPAYRLAVASVNANLDSVASPDVVLLASQLAALVAQYTKP